MVIGYAESGEMVFKLPGRDRARARRSGSTAQHLFDPVAASGKPFKEVGRQVPYAHEEPTGADAGRTSRATQTPRWLNQPPASSSR